MKQLNPMWKDNAIQIFKIDSQKHKVITNKSEFIVDGNSCSCGHTRDYTPSRSAGLEQSYNKRRMASCSHQKAVLNAKDIGPCSNCRNREVRENKMHAHGRHVMSKYICTQCGENIAHI